MGPLERNGLGGGLSLGLNLDFGEAKIHKRGGLDLMGAPDLNTLTKSLDDDINEMNGKLGKDRNGFGKDGS